MIVIDSFNELAREVVLLHPRLNPLSLLVMDTLIYVQLAEVVGRLSKDESKIDPSCQHRTESEELLGQRERYNITIHDCAHRARR